MKVTFEIDTERTHEAELRAYRFAAAYLLHLAGDLNDEDELAEHTHTQTTTETATVGDVSHTVTTTVPVPPPPPPVFVPPPPPLVPADSSDVGEDTSDAPASNVLHFPVPPPPPSANTAAPIPPAPPAMTAGVVGTVVSAEVDSAGMPYDARIHQKGKGKKKDLTWKLIKGIDPAIVVAVTAELAARKGAVAPVSLPQGQNSVPLPPQSNATAATGVPAPPVAPTVPVPPAPAVGAVPSAPAPFRDLVDKLTAATKANLITPAKVNEICQEVGAPNLMQLNTMPALIPEVNSRVDAFLAGLG